MQQEEKHNGLVFPIVVTIMFGFIMLGGDKPWDERVFDSRVKNAEREVYIAKILAETEVQCN